MPRRRNHLPARSVLVPMLVSGLLWIVPAHADPGAGAESNPAIDKAMAAIEGRDYGKAVKYLKRHLRDSGNDADALNLMGFSLRKLDKYEAAEDYYMQALEIEPKHLGANEYLGELYLQTNRPELARERLAVLEKACPDSCTERRDLDDAFARYSNGEGP